MAFSSEAVGLEGLAHLAVTLGPVTTVLWSARMARMGGGRGQLFLMPPTFATPQVVELPVTERQIEREHLIQLRRWQETRGELQCPSPPRLHGAKAILEAEPGPRPSLQPSPSIRLPPDAPLSGSKGKSKASKQVQKEPREPARESGQQGRPPTPSQAKAAAAAGDASPPQDAPAQDPAPQDSAHHRSRESLTSQESEDTYL